MLEAQERAKHIRLEHRSEAVWRLLNHRTRLAFRASIVDGDIEAAEARNGPVDQMAYIALAPHVRLNERRLRAKPTQFDLQGFAFGFVATGCNDPCALFGKSQC